MPLPVPSVGAQQERKCPGRVLVMCHIHHCSVRRDCGDANKRFCLWNCLDLHKTLRFVLPGCRNAWKWLLWQTGQAAVPGRGSESWGQSGSLPNAEFSGVRGWERQECCLSRLHPRVDTDIFWQVFTPKGCKDVPGPDPKVLQALSSDSVVKEPELPHRCRTGHYEGSPGCSLSKHWKDSGNSSWSLSPESWGLFMVWVASQLFHLTCCFNL